MKQIFVKTGETMLLDQRQKKTGKPVPVFIRSFLPVNKYDPRTARRPKEALKASRRTAQ